ncbi:uncharacterized protein LOC143064966 isoform X4 [Mytilus galloprovincialis]|uniref:uncharacterized protein LOC143064966 isoform X4 n=1 Tax=Mytilus galloprovincialis TaxID=29158 RepID=UPI003F7B9943
MKSICIIALVLCVMVAHVRSQAAGIHGSHLHGGTGNSNEMLRYVQVILARLANLEKQQAQQNTQSNNGLFGGNSGLSNYILYESLF